MFLVSLRAIGYSYNIPCLSIIFQISPNDLLPREIKADLGQDVKFSVSASGMPSLIYHWYFWPSHGKPMLDWIPLTGVHGCEITIDAMRLEDVGIYKCFVEHRLQVCIFLGRGGHR